VLPFYPNSCNASSYYFSTSSSRYSPSSGATHVPSQYIQHLESTYSRFPVWMIKSLVSSEILIHFCRCHAPACTSLVKRSPDGQFPPQTPESMPPPGDHSAALSPQPPPSTSSPPAEGAVVPPAAKNAVPGSQQPQPVSPTTNAHKKKKCKGRKGKGGGGETRLMDWAWNRMFELVFGLRLGSFRSIRSLSDEIPINPPAPSSKISAAPRGPILL
jgi:hypothetical protein